MKHAKKPTRAQKLMIGYYHLKPENWLVRSASPDELNIEHRYTGQRRTTAPDDSGGIHNRTQGQKVQKRKENPVQNYQNKRVYLEEAFAALGEAARSLGINTSAPAPKAKKKSIEEINRLARDAGMSYGQYVASLGRK